MAYHLDHIDVLNVKIQFQKLSPSVLAPELAAGQSSMIVLKAKESFSIEKNKYAKAYTGLILNLPRGGCGVVSPLPLKESINKSTYCSLHLARHTSQVVYTLESH